MSEWIEWNGGKCPVASDTLVEVRWRDGDVGPVSRADAWYWAAGSGAFNICAYRVVEEAPRPAATETAAASAQGTITAMLTERGKRYGKFEDHSEVSQALKKVVFTRRPRETLAADQVEALEMICHKLGRIANGDPDYVDSWVDIAGYAKLVADRLEGVSK